MAFNKKNAKSYTGALVLAGLFATSTGCTVWPYGEDKTQEPVKPQISKAEQEAKADAAEDADFQVLEEAPKAAKAEAPKPQVLQAEPVVEKKAAAHDHSAMAQEPVKPAVKLVLPTEPNTFLITKGLKDKTHPKYGDGHPNGFMINGVMGNDVVVRRGQTYTFQVKTDPKHDVYISTSPVGWSAGVYTAGVVGQFIFDGEMTITIDDNTPSTLYYQCQNHKNMGGKIVVVAADADVDAVKAKLAEERKAVLAKVAAAGSKPKVSKGKASQKVAYAKMMLQIKAKSLSDAAKKSVGEHLTVAKAAMDKGDFVAAYAAAEKAGEFFKTPATAKANAAAIAEKKKSYNEKLESIESIEASHARAYKKAETPVDYDRPSVEVLLKKADALAKKQKYDDAIKELSKVEYLVSHALNGMLGSRTVVFELKFDTPKDEYIYERKRYKSYLELIPTALEARKPSQKRIARADKFVDKAKFYAGKAEESLEAGRYEEAIVIIKDATSQVRIALMALGVSM
jgi:tetratricopeptide (TPR) repeat protein